MFDGGHDSEPVQSFECTSTDCPSWAVVIAASEASGDDPEELEPLYTVIDPDSLNSLFARTQTAQSRGTGRVGFEYHGYWVVVEANGRGYLFESAD